MKLAPPATRGVIDSNNLYSLDAIKDRLDVGPAWMKHARECGLRVHRFGRKGFVLGSDFISFLQEKGRIDEQR